MLKLLRNSYRYIASRHALGSKNIRSLCVSNFIRILVVLLAQNDPSKLVVKGSFAVKSIDLLVERGLTLASTRHDAGKLPLPLLYCQKMPDGSGLEPNVRCGARCYSRRHR